MKLLAGTAALGLLLATQRADAADLMKDRDIEREIVGQSIVWWEADGWRRGSLLLAPDGRAEITVDDPEAAADSGRWTLRGDQVCTVWNGLRDGEEKCYGLSRVGDGRFVTTGGNVFEVRFAGA